jgi:hypothetical protein
MNAGSDKRKPKPAKDAPAGRARSKKASDPALPSVDVSVGSRPPSNGATGATSPTPDRAAPDLNGLIQERAYRLYQSSGCQQGHALEHWLEAERQVMRSLQSERADHDRTTGEDEKASRST